MRSVVGYEFYFISLFLPRRDWRGNQLGPKTQWLQIDGNKQKIDNDRSHTHGIQSGEKKFKKCGVIKLWPPSHFLDIISKS